MVDNFFLIDLYRWWVLEHSLPGFLYWQVGWRWLSFTCTSPPPDFKPVRLLGKDDIIKENGMYVERSEPDRDRSGPPNIRCLTPSSWAIRRLQTLIEKPWLLHGIQHMLLPLCAALSLSSLSLIASNCNLFLIFLCFFFSYGKRIIHCTFELLSSKSWRCRIRRWTSFFLSFFSFPSFANLLREIVGWVVRLLFLLVWGKLLVL